MAILAIDIGTSSVKAALLDAEGRVTGPIAREAYALDHPTPAACEAPAERVWAAVVSAARAVVASVKLHAGERAGAKDVEGVGLSCLTPALVLLGRNDEPLAPVWFHLDRRARSVAREVFADRGEAFVAFAANLPLPGGMSAILYKALLKEKPGLEHEVRSYLHLSSWLGMKLSGERFFDPANAAFTGLYPTLTGKTWSPEWCRYFGVNEEWLPPIVPGDTTIGELTREAALAFGCSAGIPVKLGTADTSSACLAADIREGELLHVVGTTQVLAVIAKNPSPHPRRLVRPLGVGSAFLHVTHNPIGGAAFEWLRELCFGEMSADEFYESAVPKAAAQKTPVTLAPPFLGGDRLELEERFASFNRLRLWSNRYDLLSALITSMKEEHGGAVSALGVGESFRRIVISGGGATLMKKFLPGYAEASVLENGSLRGVARLF